MLGVRFPMESLEFFFDNPSGRTMALELTQPLTEMSTSCISWGVEAAGLTTLPSLYANCLEILGVSTSWSPKGLSSTVQGLLYLFMYSLHSHRSMHKMSQYGFVNCVPKKDTKRAFIVCYVCVYSSTVYIHLVECRSRRGESHVLCFVNAALTGMSHSPPHLEINISLAFTAETVPTCILSAMNV